jgi:invasion protein IalB
MLTRMRAPMLSLLLVLPWSMLGVLAPVPAQEVSPLPGGASALREIHGDWTVDCVLAGEPLAKVCALTQEQLDPSRRRQLAIELSPAGETLMGRLSLPFGLALEEGIVIGVDDSAPATALRFSTCLPAGCIVPLRFEPEMTRALRSGAVLHIVAAADGGAAAPFAVSLRGFAGALERTITLLQ